MSQERATAHVDLDAIRHNIALVADRVGGIDRVMLVVKADAYGHGAVPVARTARHAGVPWLGVALPSEAVALREAGDTGRILAWLFPPGDPGIDECVRRDVDLSVATVDALDEVLQAGRRAGREPAVHLKVDTGLGRGGSALADWERLARAAASAQARVVSVWSHLARADEPTSSETDRQLAAYRDALGIAEEAGLRPELRHIANSAAALTRPDAVFDLVRLGIAGYGITPGLALGTAADLRLRPAMTLTARVAMVKRLPAGHGVSYGHDWRAERETTVALVPIGYADGVPRGATGSAEVLLGGVRRPVVGRIAMDQVIVDVGDDDVRAGDDVIVFGPGDAGEPTAEDLAAADGTIGYEIVARIGPRVVRRYQGSS